MYKPVFLYKTVTEEQRCKVNVLPSVVMNYDAFLVLFILIQCLIKASALNLFLAKDDLELLVFLLLPHKYLDARHVPLYPAELVLKKKKKSM